jgi:transposase
LFCEFSLERHVPERHLLRLIDRFVELDGLRREPGEEVHLNLAYRWFCRLGLGGAVPDLSTFSKNRHGRFRERAYCSAALLRVWLVAKALLSTPA